MPIGAGLAPAGTSSAGYGVPDTAHTPVNGVLPDALTGLPQPGRLINPATGSYLFTADGRVQGVSRAQQLVQLAMSTIAGSSALPSLGHTLGQIQEKGVDLLSAVTAAVTTAFAPIVSQGLVTLNSVDVQDYTTQTPDRALILVKWTDNTTSTQHVTPL